MLVQLWRKKKFFCNYYTGKVFFYIVTNLVIAYFTFIISPTTKSTITRVHLYSNIFLLFLTFYCTIYLNLILSHFLCLQCPLVFMLFFYIFESKIVCKINVKVSWTFFFHTFKMWLIYVQSKWFSFFDVFLWLDLR